MQRINSTVKAQWWKNLSQAKLKMASTAKQPECISLPAISDLSKQSRSSLCFNICQIFYHLEVGCNQLQILYECAVYSNIWVNWTWIFSFFTVTHLHLHGLTNVSCCATPIKSKGMTELAGTLIWYFKDNKSLIVGITIKTLIFIIKRIS